MQIDVQLSGVIISLILSFCPISKFFNYLIQIQGFDTVNCDTDKKATIFMEISSISTFIYYNICNTFLIHFNFPRFCYET
jgi:hypothetical protein